MHISYRTTFLILFFFGLMGMMYLMFRPYPGQDALEARIRAEELANNAPTPMMPDYGSLTQEEMMIADRAIGDLLNTNQGIMPSMIRVVSLEKQDFSDGSLGCPEEGMVYTQAIVSGYRVLLAVGDTEYDYRLDEEDTVRICPAVP